MRKIFHQIIRFFMLMGFAFLVAFSSGSAKTWLVGPDFQLKSPSQAIKLAKDGDIIKIMAGLYENDYARITQNDIMLIGVNGFAHLKSSGPVPGGKAIWTIDGKNVHIQNIEFSGAKVPDKNGAGVRLQNGSLTIENCYFHGNEMGLMTSGNSDINLYIYNSEFSNNRQDYAVTGRLSHNIYVGNISRFVMENSISRGAQYGHTIKSRAKNTLLRGNRIFDEGEISASYLIDLPNGGRAVIENNYLYKNKGAQNNALISYGTEGMKYKENKLSIRLNTAINEAGKAVLLRNRSNSEVILVGNTLTRISSDQGSSLGQKNLWEKIKQMFRNQKN